MYELIHATAPWQTDVEYTDDFLPKRPRIVGRERGGKKHNPNSYQSAMECLRQHPGCSVYELAVGAGYGQYRKMEIFCNLAFTGRIYMDEHDRIYPVEER